MINFWIAFRNPFKCKTFRMVKNYGGRLYGHKLWEIQLSRYAFNWLELQVDLNWRQTDHAGPWIMFGLLGWQLDLRIFDARGWNDQTNTWA